MQCNVTKKTKTKTFREHPQINICDLWDIWPEWWGGKTWPKTKTVKCEIEVWSCCHFKFRQLRPWVHHTQLPEIQPKKSCPKWDGGADKSKREELLLRKSKKQQSWWQTETAATPIFRDTHTNTHNYTQLHVITQVAKKEALLVGTHTNTHNYTQLHMLTHVSKTARFFRIMLFEIYWKMAVLKLPFPVMLDSEALDGKWKQKPSLEPPFQMFICSVFLSHFCCQCQDFKSACYLPTYLPTYLDLPTVFLRTVFFEVYSV